MSGSPPRDRARGRVRGVWPCAPAQNLHLAQPRCRALLDHRSDFQSRRVLLVEFARRGKDALASVVLMDGGREIFADYPAEFHGPGEDLWRVEDEGGIRPEGFEVLFVIQSHTSYVLGVRWTAAEGDSLSLFASDAQNRFVELIRDYRYRAPL